MAVLWSIGAFIILHDAVADKLRVLLVHMSRERIKTDSLSSKKDAYLVVHTGQVGRCLISKLKLLFPCVVRRMNTVQSKEGGPRSHAKVKR